MGLLYIFLSLKACKASAGVENLLGNLNWTQTSSTSISTCRLHDNPSTSVTFWWPASTASAAAAAAAAASPGSPGCQHGLVVSHWPGDGSGHRPQDYGDLPAPQEYAGLSNCLPALTPVKSGYTQPSASFFLFSCYHLYFLHTNKTLYTIRTMA